MLNPSNPLYTAEQVRRLEQLSIEQQSISSFALMRRAGWSAFQVLTQQWADCRAIRVFCGAGNNGGDGLIAAEHALRAGWRVEVFATITPAQFKGDARLAFEAFSDAGGRLLAKPEWDAAPVAGLVLIDALLGTGLSRDVSGEYAQWIAQINRAQQPVLSLDLPSGLNADTGQVMGCAVEATVTVSFVALKAGLFTGEAADYCGQMVYADLGVNADILAQQLPFARLLSKPPFPRRRRCAHKGNHGRVLVVGGNHGFSGAARLAAEAALRSGAGLVSVATRLAHAAVLNLGRAELMCHAVDTQESLQALLHAADVVVIGPGMGQDDWARTMLAAVWTTDKNLVVDADALNLLARHPKSRENWVLTPHPGEAARLLACDTQQIARDRFAAVRGLQARYGGVCLLKGAGTLISDGQTCWVSTAGNPGMASGGMGDVLAGIIGGLIAQGLSLTVATQLAVFVHGQAADELARRDGERGLLASDLMPEIRRLLNVDA